MQITAETMQTYKIWHITMLTAQLYLKSSLFHKMKCPSWTRVRRQKTSSGRTENGKGAKNTHFRESFVRQESCRPVTTFELAVIHWSYLFQKSTVANAITCNEIKTSFPIRKQISMAFCWSSWNFSILKVSQTSFMAALNVSEVRVASDIPSASIFKTTR